MVVIDEGIHACINGVTYAYACTFTHLYTYTRAYSALPKTMAARYQEERIKALRDALRIYQVCRGEGSNLTKSFHSVLARALEEKL